MANQTSGAAVLTKLAPDAAKVLYSTSISFMAVQGIAVDRNGNLYAGGVARPGFAPTQEAYQSTCDPTSNCGVLVKLGQTGAVQYATYSGTGPVNALAVNSHGEVWITGSSPTLAGAPPGPTFNLTASVIAKFSSDGGQRPVTVEFGAGICYSNGYSGSGSGIAIDANDAVYAVGSGPDFYPARMLSIPGTDSLHTCLTGPYIRKLDPTGKLVYATFIANANYRIFSIAVDAAGSAYFPLSYASYLLNQNCDVSGLMSTPVIVLSPDGSQVTSSGSVPGSVGAISQDEKGGVYVAGSAGSAAFVATPGAYREQLLPESPAGAFAAKLDFTKPARPSVACLVNTASGWAGRNSFAFTGAVAPGELVSLFGEGFRPGHDLRVTFDGRRAPVLYSDSGRIDAVVPFEVEGGSGLTMVSVTQGDQVIGPYPLPVSPAVPAIFGVLNEDGTVNSKSNPAAPGSVLAVFLTGAGAYNPAIDDGSIGPVTPPFPVPVAGIAARFGGAPQDPQGEVLFLGQAPGLIAGIVQVNLRVPVTIPPGASRLVTYVGNYPSPPLEWVYIGTN